MPELSRQSKPPANAVRNRERLAELRTVRSRIDDFVEEKVRVVVKPPHIAAAEDEDGIARAADIEVWSIATVDATKIAGRDRWAHAFAAMQNCLDSEINSPLSVPDKFPSVECANGSYPTKNSSRGATENFTTSFTLTPSGTCSSRLGIWVRALSRP